MKQIILPLAFFLLIINNGVAQTIIGPRAGLNLSGINGLEDSHIRSGWAIGAFIMSNKPSQRIGLSSDILVSSRGGRSFYATNSDSVSEVWNSYYNINYLEIPLLVNVFFFKESQNFRPRIFAGPSLSVKINATKNLQYHNYQITGENYISINNKTSSSYKNLDAGLLLGIGFTYSMCERTCLNVDFRYLQGLIDIRNKNQFYHSALYNHNVSILVGIGYQIGNRH
jgi:hypothetical protein